MLMIINRSVVLFAKKGEYLNNTTTIILVDMVYKRGLYVQEGT
jgi:hypothetical protein